MISDKILHDIAHIAEDKRKIDIDRLNRRILDKRIEEDEKKLIKDLDKLFNDLSKEGEDEE